MRSYNMRTKLFFAAVTLMWTVSVSLTSCNNASTSEEEKKLVEKGDTLLAKDACLIISPYTVASQGDSLTQKIYRYADMQAALYKARYESNRLSVYFGTSFIVKHEDVERENGVYNMKIEGSEMILIDKNGEVTTFANWEDSEYLEYVIQQKKYPVKAEINVESRGEKIFKEKTKY